MKRSRRENPADPPPTPPGGRRGRLRGQSHAAGGAGGGFQVPIDNGASSLKQESSSDEDAPDAWIVIRILEDGRFFHRENFAEEAAASSSAAELNHVWNEHGRYFRAVRDTPNVPVRLDDLDITVPHHVRMRLNWLERCRRWLQPALRTKRSAQMVTWTPGEIQHPLQTRMGGPAVVPQGHAVPRCALCDHATTLVALINFAGLVTQPWLTNKAAALYHCYDCPRADQQCFWIDSTQNPRLVPADGRKLARGTLLGRFWDITDYDWTLAQEFLVEGSYDEHLLGQHPFRLFTAMGTKVGGYTSWIQGAVVRKCHCGEQMSCAVQVRPQHELMLGDAGLFYVLICARGTCDSTIVVPQSF